MSARLLLASLAATLYVAPGLMTADLHALGNIRSSSETPSFLSDLDRAAEHQFQDHEWEEDLLWSRSGGRDGRAALLQEDRDLPRTLAVQLDVGESLAVEKMSLFDQEEILLSQRSTGGTSLHRAGMVRSPLTSGSLHTTSAGEKASSQEGHGTGFPEIHTLHRFVRRGEGKIETHIYGRSSEKRLNNYHSLRNGYSHPTGITLSPAFSAPALRPLIPSSYNTRAMIRPWYSKPAPYSHLPLRIRNIEVQI